MKEPTLGRIVIYKLGGTEQRALGVEAAPELPAIVVSPAVTNDLVNLQVFLNGHGTFFRQNVDYGHIGGTWHWPKLVS